MMELFVWYRQNVVLKNEDERGSFLEMLTRGHSVGRGKDRFNKDAEIATRLALCQFLLITFHRKPTLQRS